MLENLASALAVVVLVSLVSTTVFAQSDLTTANGIVKDPSGSVVPTAKVTVKNQATGLTRDVLMNSNGNFVVPTGFACPNAIFSQTLPFAVLLLLSSTSAGHTSPADAHR